MNINSNSSLPWSFFQYKMLIFNMSYLSGAAFGGKKSSFRLNKDNNMASVIALLSYLIWAAAM